MERTTECGALRTFLVVVGGLLVNFCFGLFYVFGNISSYMISYLRNRTDDTSLRNVDNLWINNAAQIVTPFAVFAGGLLDRQFGVRTATLIGCVLYCAGVGLTYFTIKKSLVFVALSYGTLMKFGSFIAYGPPAQTVVKWLPRRPTFAVGLILCGSGAGALTFNQVVTVFINPKNLSPDFQASDGERYFTDGEVLDMIPHVFLILAGVCFSLQVLGIILLSPKSDDEKINSKGSDESEERDPLNIQQESKKHIVEEKVPMKTVLYKVLTDKNAYIWLLIFFLLYGGMTFVNVLYKAYGQTFISDDHFMALIGSMAAVFNSGFRPIWGLIMDKYGFQVTVKFASASFVCLSATLILTESLGKVAFLLWICGLYASSCCIMALGPVILGKLYGVDYMAINMAFTYTGMSVAAITTGFVGLYLQSVIGWHGLFLLTAFMNALAFFVSFFFNGRDTQGQLI